MDYKQIRIGTPPEVYNLSKHCFKAIFSSKIHNTKTIIVFPTVTCRQMTTDIRFLKPHF